MANVSFNEPQYGARTARSTRSYLGSLVIRSGLAKTQAGAQTILLLIAVLLSVATYFAAGLLVSDPLPTTDIVPSPVKQ